MDTTLVINPGSSSKKYGLYRGGRPLLIVKFEQTGNGVIRCLITHEAQETCVEIPSEAYQGVLHTMFELCIEHGFIDSAKDITQVGIRIVAPGSFFAAHRLVDATFVEKLNERSGAAPLHIPAMLAEIRVVQKMLPQVELYAISDSAFHRTLPIEARTYAIPPEDAAKYDVYHFGYHGISVASVVHTLRSQREKLPRRVVVCHIGSGVSVVALRDGISIDTSMGFSPLSGVAMGTRAGDIDPGALLFLLGEKELSADAAYTYFYTKSGLYGLTGASDLRVVIERSQKGDTSASDALATYFYTIKKEIGASIAALGGLDLLVFTATAAERNPLVRASVCSGLEGLGIRLDPKKNTLLNGISGEVGVRSEAVDIQVVCTDEMGEMARAVEEL